MLSGKFDDAMYSGGKRHLQACFAITHYRVYCLHELTTALGPHARLLSFSKTKLADCQRPSLPLAFCVRDRRYSLGGLFNASF